VTVFGPEPGLEPGGKWFSILPHPDVQKCISDTLLEDVSATDNMPKNKVIFKCHSYPYPIPQVKCPPDAILQKIDPWEALEFFLNEALLRSSKVHELYREAEATAKNHSNKLSDYDFLLFDPHGITWTVITGEHHELLRPKPAPFRPHWVPLPAPQPELLARAGITDVGASVKEGHSWFWNLAMNAADPRHVYLAIDIAYPPETILKALKPMLRARNRMLFDEGSIWIANKRICFDYQWFNL